MVGREMRRRVVVALVLVLLVEEGEGDGAGAGSGEKCGVEEDVEGVGWETGGGAHSFLSARLAPKTSRPS